MNSPNLTGLYEILEEEQKCCAQLLKVSREEQQSLVDNDLKRLGGKTREMQSTVRALRRLHIKRRELLEEIGRDLKMRPGEVTFHSVIDRLGGRAAAVLKDKLSHLIKVGEALYNVNQQTIYLINFSMGLVDKQVDLWADFLNEGEGYGETGETKSEVFKAKIIEGKV